MKQSVQMKQLLHLNGYSAIVFDIFATASAAEPCIVSLGGICSCMFGSSTDSCSAPASSMSSLSVSGGASSTPAVASTSSPMASSSPAFRSQPATASASGTSVPVCGTPNSSTLGGSFLGPTSASSLAPAFGTPSPPPSSGNGGGLFGAGASTPAPAFGTPSPATSDEADQFERCAFAPPSGPFSGGRLISFGGCLSSGGGFAGGPYSGGGLFGSGLAGQSTFPQASSQSASSPLFSSPQSSSAPFGTSLFGGSGGFGDGQPALGTLSAPAFGASSLTPPAFGPEPRLFGSPPEPSSLFGTPPPPPPPPLGTASGTRPFGSSLDDIRSRPDHGTREVPFQKTEFADGRWWFPEAMPVVTFVNITAMPLYDHKSVEELRFEDYQTNAKSGPSGPDAQPSGMPAASPAFGAPGPASHSGAPSLFGAASSPFGGLTTSTTAFGASSLPSWPPSGGFGYLPHTSAPGSASAFGASSTPAFSGGGGAFGRGGGAFGMPSLAPAFGFESFAYGTPGASSAPAFGPQGEASQGLKATPDAQLADLWRALEQEDLRYKRAARVLERERLEHTAAQTRLDRECLDAEREQLQHRLAQGRDQVACITELEWSLEQKELQRRQASAVCEREQLERAAAQAKLERVRLEAEACRFETVTSPGQHADPAQQARTDSAGGDAQGQAAEIAA